MVIFYIYKILIFNNLKAFHWRNWTKRLKPAMPLPVRLAVEIILTSHKKDIGYYTFSYNNHGFDFGLLWRSCLFPDN